MIFRWLKGWTVLITALCFCVLFKTISKSKVHLLEKVYPKDIHTNSNKIVLTTKTSTVPDSSTSFHKNTRSGINLFTTDRDCHSWKFKRQWKDIGYSPECLNDSRIHNIVKSYCYAKPTKIIQYSDIARLLVLYEKGGWYVDSDVRPTPRCATEQAFSETTFGLESNFATLDEANEYGMLQKSLSLWTIYGKKGDPRLLHNACLLAKLAEQEQAPHQSIHNYILVTSGPSAQTRLWNGTVLPISAFGCGQAHSNSPPCTAKSCWGCHEFKGRWL